MVPYLSHDNVYSLLHPRGAHAPFSLRTNNTIPTMNPNTIQVNLGEYEITLLIGDSGQLAVRPAAN